MILLWLFSLFIISTTADSVIKKCELPFLPIHEAYFNLSEAQLHFPTHYIFLLNTNLDKATQEQMLSIYHSMTCMIPSYSNFTKFHLITLGEKSVNATKINYGTIPEKWISIFQNNASSSTASGINSNEKVINICDQLIQGLHEFILFEEENNQQILKHSLKNFVMFQMLDNYLPDLCGSDLNAFLAENNLTNTIGISQNVITYGLSGPPQQHLSSPTFNDSIPINTVQKDPTFFTGALMNLHNFYGFNNSNILYASIEPFVNEMVGISLNFIKAYTTRREVVVNRFIEDMFADFPTPETSTAAITLSTTVEPKSSPSIQTVTIFAVILAILFLAFIILLSSYDHSLFTDQSNIRERARALRQNRSRRDTETVALVEVPMDDLSEAVFGESPRVQSFCEHEPPMDLSQTEPPTIFAEDSIQKIQCPNLTIQIDDDNLAEIKLGN